MATDEWDGGIVAKMERALALCDELQEEQRRLRGGHDDTREYSSTSNERFRQDENVWMKWWLTKSVPPIPLSFAALLGDAIQDFRAALEYSAWAAASEEARVTKPKMISFPIIASANNFAQWVTDRDGWFNDDVVEVLDSAQPFLADRESVQVDRDLLHPLRILRVLSNTDKHRLLNVVDHAHIELGVDLDPMPLAYTWRTAQGPVEEGGWLATLVFPRPARPMPIDVRPSFGWYESVAYEEPGQEVRWLRLDEMMTALSDFAIRTVGLMSGARIGYRGDQSSHEPDQGGPSGSAGQPGAP